MYVTLWWKGPRTGRSLQEHEVGRGQRSPDGNDTEVFCQLTRDTPAVKRGLRLQGSRVGECRRTQSPGIETQARCGRSHTCHPQTWGAEAGGSSVRA